MLQRNFNSFLAEDNHHGCYTFTSDSCALCEQFEKDLKTYDTGNWMAIEVSKDEEFILKTIFNFSGFPFTIVFIDNYPALVKKGILFQKQMNEIFEFLKLNKMQIKKVVSTPVTAYTPIIIGSPAGNEEYRIKVYNDSIERGEAPIDLYSTYCNLLFHGNHTLVSKLQEAWGLLVKKSVLYVDEGVDDIMLNEILDATAHNREVEFRKCHD